MQLAPGGRRYALILAALAGLGFLVSAWAAVGFVLLAGFVLWFFRDPDRTTPPTGFVSPADGRVSVVREENGRLRVGVFMSPFDVHVNRAPVAGTVESIRHTPGAHRPAFSKDSDRNERVHVRVDLDDGRTATVVLIAGAFARRITPYPEEGDRVDRGDRIGHIAFGSRADVVFPPDVGRDALRVAKGESVRAGESVLAGGR